MSGTVRKWTRSYRTRLALSYALVVAVFAVAWAWSLFGPLTSMLVDQQKQGLTAIANAGATMAEDSDASWQDIADALADRTGARLTIVASDGSILADSNEYPAAMENHASRPEVAAALSNRIGEDQRTSRTEGTEQLYVAVPADARGERVAVRASQQVANIELLVARSRRFGLVLLLTALALAVAIAAGVSRGLAEPVQRLSWAAKQMAAGDLGAEIPRPGGELGVLADSLGDLRSQIRARIEDLEAEQRSMRSVLDGLADAVFLLHDETIRFANRAASELFRTPRAGWRGLDVASAGFPAALTARILDLLKASEAHAEEIGPDPTGRSLRVLVEPLSPMESGSRTLVVISDVTERACLDRMRRDFVANASHELKTPAAAIGLLAQAAADASEDGDEARQREFVEKIMEESVRLQRLVKDLLDLSRLETAARPAAITDVREAASNALLGHNVAAAARGLTLTLDDSAASREDAFAAVDPTDLAVALDNLLDNAVAYTESGGVTVKLSVDDATVQVDVVDTGVGIPEEELPRIFERFYRVDRARSRDSGGTGLGLALARHAVENAGGTLQVLSKPDEGSTFTIRLPRAG